jgi:DsbC/DsbD-like thiol-disulfide interchange protein
MAIERKMPIRAFFALVLAAQACPAVAQEAAFASQSVKAPHSAARLLAAGAPSGGVYRAGVEIDLEPKTITYWRQPGDAGSPPQFDFSRSENVASVEVLYPAPKRIVEAESEVAGYDTRVIFPLRVTPRNPAAPVSLRLFLDYAACGNICLPAKAQLSLALPTAGESPYANVIAEAEAKAPKRLAEEEAKQVISIARTGGGENEPAWSLRYTGAGRAQDLFIEAPEPFFIESKRGAKDNSFELRLASSCCSKAAAKSESIAATVTIVTDKGAIEAPARLD